MILFVCMKLRTLLIAVLFFVSLITFTRFKPVYAGSWPGCDATSLVGSGHLNTYDCTAPGTGGCGAGLSCCPVSFTGGGIDGHYTNIYASICTVRGTKMSTPWIVDNNIWTNGNWWFQPNGGFSSVAVSPCSFSPKVTGYNSALPDYTTCGPGQSVVCHKWSNIGNYDCYCAYASSNTGTAQCCVDTVSSTNGAPACGAKAGAQSPTLCCDPAPVQCKDVTGGTNTACIVCKNKLDACDPSGSAKCCDGSLCRAVYHNPSDPVSSPAHNICYDKPVTTCLNSKAPAGAVCQDNGECVSGSCKFQNAGDLYKSCTAIAQGSPCCPGCSTASAASCACGSGLTCRMNYTANQNQCLPPITCKAVGATGCEIGNPDSCCSSGSHNATCTDVGGTPTCVQDSATCLAPNIPECSTTTPCCNPGQYDCVAAGGGTHVCAPKATCNHSAGDTCDPSDTSSCCNSGAQLRCSGGICADVSASQTCTREGQCGDLASNDCLPGRRCTSGICTNDTMCDLTGMPYTGPILEFNTLIAQIYKFMYPAGIAFGILLMILSGYKIMMSEGNPIKVKEAQEQLTAAVIGVIFIILAIAIMRVIIKSILGVNVSF